MPKKKGNSKQIPNDFTLNDYANAQKMTIKMNKCPAETNDKIMPQNPPEVSWDQISDHDEFDLIQEVNSDGSTNLAYVKRPNTINNFNEYPEIIWHEISRRINPDDIGRFAMINKTTYAITKQKSFWVNIYEKYCKHSPKLPQRLRIEDGAKPYGYKTRTIRALFHTYTPFTKRVIEQGMHDSKPHAMVKRRCVNMWFRKNKSHWALFFKFKKLSEQPAISKEHFNLIEQLERLDANPEQDHQVLQVNCETFSELRAHLLGWMLTSVKVGLSKNFRSHKLFMGFNSGAHVVKNVLPEYSLNIDTVTSIMVIDWWHPSYPHFDIKIPWPILCSANSEEYAPMLNEDFFAPYEQPSSSF